MLTRLKPQFLSRLSWLSCRDLRPPRSFHQTSGLSSVTPPSNACVSSTAFLVQVVPPKKLTLLSCGHCYNRTIMECVPPREEKCRQKQHPYDARKIPRQTIYLKKTKHQLNVQKTLHDREKTSNIFKVLWTHQHIKAHQRIAGRNRITDDAGFKNKNQKLPRNKDTHQSLKNQKETARIKTVYENNI